MLGIDLNGRTAIVTGATRGIGLGVSEMLAKAGCHIAGCSTQPSTSETVQRFTNRVTDHGVRAFHQTCNMTRPEEVADFVKATATEFGSIDILISNAGVNVFKGVDACTLDEWAFNADLNLRAHWLISKACRPYLAKSPFGGCIVVMTSNHAYHSIPGCFPYNTTKAALPGLVRAMALEWKNSIRVVGLAPGFIETEGGEAWFQGFDNPEKEKQQTIDRHLVPKLGAVEEVGAFCAFLASGYASFMTGATYLMDGGRSAIMQDE